MKNETEIKILKAAELEFMSKGYAGARTTSIAERAGVTHAMIHYYFRTKEKIFEKIIAEKMSILRDIIRSSLIDTSSSLEEVIKKLIDNHLEFLSANPDLPRFLINEVISQPERSEKLKEKFRDLSFPVLQYLQKIIDGAVSRGECRYIESRKLILDIVSLNVFPYLAAPIVYAAFGDCMRDPSFLEERKKENYDTIIRKLKI